MSVSVVKESHVYGDDHVDVPSEEDFEALQNRIEESLPLADKITQQLKTDSAVVKRATIFSVAALVLSCIAVAIGIASLLLR